MIRQPCAFFLKVLVIEITLQVKPIALVSIILQLNLKQPINSTFLAN